MVSAWIKNWIRLQYPSEPEGIWCGFTRSIDTVVQESFYFARLPNGLSAPKAYYLIGRGSNFPV